MTTTEIPEYLIESNDFHALTPTLSGVPHLTGIEFAVMLSQQRATDTDFTTAQTVGQEIGVFTGGRSIKGTYDVWYRVLDVSPEEPWFNCGPTFKLV